jgi:nucleotide-binding universal stress UspA family protein
MTGYRSILACLSDADSAPATLDLAFSVGRDHLARVEALHVRPDPTSAVPLVGEGMSGAMVEEMLAAAERQAAEEAGRIRRQFDQACLRFGVEPGDVAPATQRFSATWREEVGREEDVVAHSGRLADLLVLARPSAERDTPSLLTLNAALMDSGRPVLVVPPGGASPVGKRIAVLWNGSVEASRAVAGALPVLERADAVAVLSAREEGGGHPGDLAAYLAWHGIQATVHSFAAAGPAGVALLSQATALGADLVVMGAYTHSRLRQLILGGVTRHVLHDSPLPVLLSH